MGYQSDRERFFMLMGREFPKATPSDALALLRAASGEQRWNEIQCSINVGDAERARLEKQSGRRMLGVRVICAAIGATLEENGDPRGYPFMLKAPNGNGVGVPGRGLPARCFR